MTAYRRAGFTLIELLVVVAIVMVLMSLTLTVTTSVREAARRSVCAGRIKQMVLATFAYGNDNQGMLPPGGGWNNPSKGSWSTDNVAYLGLMGYLDKDMSDPTWRKRFFTCPSTSPGRLPVWASDINYSFYGGIPLDYPLTLARVVASAQRNFARFNWQLPNSQITLFSDNTWTVAPGFGPGGYSVNCNHKRRSGVVWGGADEGYPAGANAGQSDGSVVWANAAGDNGNDRELYGTVTMAYNGGSIGGWELVPTNMVWFRLDGNGNLDNTRTYGDNYLVGARLNMNFQRDF